MLLKVFIYPLLKCFQYHLQKASVNVGVRIQMLSVMEQEVMESNRVTQSILYKPFCFRR